jgi:hypothetical protein
MDTRLRTSWLPVTGLIFGLVLLIGIVEDRIPARGVSTWLMLGIVLVGFAGILVWTYGHRELPHRQTQACAGKQQTVNLIAEPQLGVFDHDQNQNYPVHKPVHSNY